MIERERAIEISLQFIPLPKLEPGDKVAVLSPSYAAPGRWPHIYQIGLQRLRDRFGLNPVAYPSTAKIGASSSERATDLISAFTDPNIKAVISSLGGSDQVTYVKKLPNAPFRENPKPYFGFSDNSHIMNHLWLNGVPSFYGGELFSQFAQLPDIDPLTEWYLQKALFERGTVELRASEKLNDFAYGWDTEVALTQPTLWEPNAGWTWNGSGICEGFTWGGCLESIDDMLRHGVRIPSLEQFSQIILITETSGEVPNASYVDRVYRALGERGVLSRVQSVIVGRPRAWKPDKPLAPPQKATYRAEQQQVILDTIRQYNSDVPVIQNVDFGHTYPQICIPYGAKARLDSGSHRLAVDY